MKMKIQNVCLFPHYENDRHSLHPVSFVRETERLTGEPYMESVYKMHFVEVGTGVLTVRDQQISLSEGDLFFTFPGTAYAVKMEGEYSCLYVSFLGSRANQILDQLDITPYRFHFTECNCLRAHFSTGLSMGRGVSEWMSESCLLFAFSHLGERMRTEEAAPATTDSAAQRVKTYIDENFSDFSLSLESIGAALAFHPKYVSSAFKRQMHLCVSQYVTTIRIQHACALMDAGMRTVSEIAARCGFSDAQYFSKVFKKKMNATPVEYMRSLSRESKQLFT